VPYVKWTGLSRIDQDASLKAVLKDAKRTKLAAVPVDSEKLSSPWLTAPVAALAGIRKVIGKNEYKGWEGVNTGGLNGCFWVRIKGTLENGSLSVENLHNVGKIKVPQVEKVIEPGLVYPLLRGRDVLRWQAKGSAHIILAQDPETGKGISESEMKRLYPKTFEYLKEFEGTRARPQRGTLRGRALFKLYFRETDPFYSMYNVGPYTLADWKVLYKRLSDAMQAVVIPKGQIPHEKLILIPAGSRSEAHYIAALLNSSPANLLLRGAAVRVQTNEYAPSDISHLAISTFDTKQVLHVKLSALSEKAHAAATKDDSAGIAELELEIDEAAAKLWGLTDDELKAIQAELAEVSKSKTVAKGEEDD
jgi:hypothetical protein